MNKSKLSDQILVNTFGRTGEEISSLIKNDDELKYLNKYRSALSLWSEYTEDTKQKIIVTLDGRDTAGKGSNIKRVVEYFDLKRHRINAYGIPETKERFEYNWFKRYKDDFPRKGQVAFYDRSWYNRAGVEAAMGFCTEEEYKWFFENVNDFEKDQIIDKGIKLIKIYLSVKKEIQKMRLKKRENVLKNWKSSPIDKVAQEKRNYYSLAKVRILEATDSEHAPWTVLDSNEKWLSSVEIIKAIINTSQEVASIIGKEIDLSTNPKIVKNAKQELENMKESGIINNMKKKFNFKVLNEEEETELQMMKEKLIFVPETYSYISK